MKQATSISERLANVGRAIKIARAKFSISQQELARKAHISPNYLSLIEKGRKPSIKALESIAKALNIPPEELLLREDMERAYRFYPILVKKMEKNAKRLLCLLEQTSVGMKKLPRKNGRGGSHAVKTKPLK